MRSISHEQRHAVRVRKRESGSESESFSESKKEPKQTNKQTNRRTRRGKGRKKRKKNTQLIEFRFGQTSNLVLMRYCAKATDSAEPVMVMVRSVLLSRSSQLDMRIMAPLICLWSSQNKQNERQINIFCCPIPLQNRQLVRQGE